MWLLQKCQGHSRLNKDQIGVYKATASDPIHLTHPTPQSPTQNGLARLFAALRLSQTWVTQSTLLVHPMYTLRGIQCVPQKRWTFKCTITNRHVNIWIQTFKAEG